MNDQNRTADGDENVGKVHGSHLVAAGVASGRRLLQGVDDFVLNLTAFDRQARVGLRAEVVTVTQKIYLDYVASQVMAWTPEEIKALRGIVAEIDALLAKRWNFRLPSPVHLVKTTGQEEGRAAYTRSDDTIVLPAGKVDTILAADSGGDPLFPRKNTTPLRDVLIHELFHLVSKNNDRKREALYRRIHHAETGVPVELPDVPWPTAESDTRMPDLKITNPDTPLLDVYVELTVPSDPRDPASPPVTRQLLPVLMADGPYRGGSFFDYLTWYFMAVRQESSGWVAVLGPDGRPLMYKVERDSELWNQYLEKVGRNTMSELFHPEEVIAQNFVFSALLPSSDLLTDISGILAEGT
ncbi:hypothetical protein [Streptomyces sp. NPDC046727]|uniref:hypothetical protein n=1 Tax=Streptomyces sp. NPDC046727 TaxID=3155373 RepID=UPI0033DA92C1